MINSKFFRVPKKKEVLKFLSSRINVMAEARKGKDNINNIDVIYIENTNKDNWENSTVFIFLIVIIRFIPPNKELIPAKCNAIIK